MIKKILAAVLIFSILLSFSGCAAVEQKAGPLRICIDMTFTGSWAYTPGRFARELEAYLEDEKRIVGHVDDVEIELIPEEDEERTEAIERIRAETENGGGPDLFLISNATKDTIGENALFPFPEIAMESGMFLSLDEYIENAEYTDWSELYEVIMAAGRTENGQQIVPLSYTLPVTCFKQYKVEHTPSMELKWEDMVEDKTRILQASALWLRTKLNFYPQWEDDYLEYILGESVDFEKGDLLFGEEELLSVMKDILKLANAEMRGKYETIPAHYQVSMNSQYRVREYGEDALFAGIKFDEALTMVPLYSVNGGTTASVVSFAAVNANSGQPETAFQVIDFLLSRPMQMASELYQSFLGDLGMPMHTKLMLDGAAINTYKGERSLPKESSDAYRSVLEAITYVRFRNTLEVQLDDLFKEFYEEGMTNGVGDSEKIRRIVSEGHKKMQETVKQAKTE